jgi:nitrite reductase (NADH) small subunit
MTEWTRVCALEEIPVLGARVFRTAREDISVFRNDADEVFALHDKCPHRGGPLSQGIVHGRSVTCPLHNWKIDLVNGEAIAPDAGCARVYGVKVVDGAVMLALSFVGGDGNP